MTVRVGLVGAGVMVAAEHRDTQLGFALPGRDHPMTTVASHPDELRWLREALTLNAVEDRGTGGPEM